MAILTATAFALLLTRLDSDKTKAAEKYEELRLKLVKCFVWKGCPESNADSLADETLDRVAAKLAQGIKIKSLAAYACEVSRFVWLEYTRKRKEDNFGDQTPEIAVEPDIPEEPDLRLSCLASCLINVTTEENDRALILGYYDADAGEKNKDQRKNLAEKFRMTTNTLKVKACRLRERLEKCINECVKRRA